MKKNSALRKSDILYHVVKGWRVILLFALIGLIAGVALIGASYIRGEVSREYRINTTFAVITPREGETASANAKSSSAAIEEDGGKKNNITEARAMTDTVILIIKSQKNMRAVIDKLNLRGVTETDISRNLNLAKQRPRSSKRPCCGVRKKKAFLS